MATLRILHDALVSAAGVAGIVAVVLPATEADAPATLFAAIIVAGALVSFGMILWSRRRPLDTSSPTALATSYRGVYVVALGLGWNSPRADVARRQAEITATGSPLSLEAALDGRLA